MESGPLSESSKEDPIEAARDLAQECHSRRSETVVVYLGGLRNSGSSDGGEEARSGGGGDREE